MRKIRLEKVTVHMAVGKSGEMLEKAGKVMAELTGQKPCFRKARRTIKDFGIRRGEPIACMVTLRHERARAFLKRALEAVGNRISAKSFDERGNFAFGIKEHIEIPETRYVPELGIFGLDVMGTLTRPGYRVKWRGVRPSKIGKRHMVTKEEAINFLKEEFKTEIIEGA
jgi:large subunit ribosomal protein L5